MSLLDRLNELFQRDSSKFIYVPIPEDNVIGPKYPAQQLEGGKHYFRLWLCEMFLARDRQWFRETYPVVHSLILFDFGNNEVEIPHVSGNLNLKNVKVENLSNVIQLNYPLTHLLPFNGGEVEINIGLLAMQGSDTLEQFIKVVGDISGLLNVPELSAVVKLAPSVTKSVEDLLGANKNGALDLGLHDTYTDVTGAGANILTSGYIAIIKAQDGGDFNPGDGRLDTTRLRVDNGRLCYLNSSGSRDLLKGFTYMLLRMELRQERDDYEALEKIYSPVNQAIEAYFHGNQVQAEQFLRSSQLEAIRSQDLTRADRNRIAQSLRAYYEEKTRILAKPVEATITAKKFSRLPQWGEGPGAVRPQPMKLEEVVRNTMSATEALAAGGPPSIK